ncbi:TetR/AcrR family transcriptional regulator, partial [Rathayibacter tanaceti]
MGRTQGFDTEQVVRAARAVFWENGFQEAALPDLEAATGLGRSSLYHAFGSKRGLFDAAVQSYLDEVVRPRLAPLVAPSGASPTALEEYFTGLRTALADPRSLSARSGCLLLNAAGAPIARDEAVR